LSVASRLKATDERSERVKPSLIASLAVRSRVEARRLLGIAHVVLDDPYRNEQGGCDHLVGLTVGNKVENFLLAISQASQMCSRARAAYAGGNSPNIKLSHGPGEQVVPRR
jgi:hypothetical protein